MKHRLPSRWISRCGAAVTAALVLRGAPAPAQTNSAADKAREVAALRTAFDAQLANIESDFTDKLLDWPDQYVRDLQALQKRLQAAGDLDGWQAADDEIKRFQNERQLQPATPAADRKEIRAVQEKYLAVPPRLDAERNRQILALRDQYVARLAALKRKLTVAGRIRDAVEANAEIERVATLPEVVEAEQESRPAGGARPPGGAPAGEAARARTTVLASGAKIYEGTTPPEIPGLTFRAIALQPTERARTLRTLSATAKLGKTGEESKVSRERVRVYAADPSPKHILRVALRAFNQGGAVEGGTLVTQYFIRPPGRASGKATPLLIGLHVVPLPRVDSTRTVTADCAPVSLFLRVDQSPLYFRGIVATFYGTIVSVFDGKRNLVFQAGSTLALDKLGVAEIPPNPTEEQRRRQAPGPAPGR
jgi:hypothetical protein